MTDSGQVTGFRPAMHTKPPTLIQRAVRAFGRFFKHEDPSKTTEQGTAGTASPSTYPQTLIAQRYERLAYITDGNELLLEDPRLEKSYEMFCYEAVRGGYTLDIEGSSGLTKRAQKIADSLPKLTPTNKLTGWGRALLVEGDLFVQAVVVDDQIVALKAMPAASMERLSDDTDEIVDPTRAFAQVDVQTWSEIATFPEALMYQARWKHRDGQRYGTPEIISVRRTWRMLKLMEEAKMIDRMVNAPRTIVWNVGTDENPGDETTLQDFKTQAGFKEGSREIFDPTEVSRNFFGNGRLSGEVLQGSTNVDQITDLLHMQDVLGSTAPTPAMLFGLDSQSVNRDVMKDLRAEWLKQTEKLNESLEEVLRWAFDLACALQGVDSTLIQYDVVWSTSTVEEPAEVVSQVVEQYGAGLLSLRSALTKLQQYNSYEDIDLEMRDIQEEASAKAALEQGQLTQPAEGGGGMPEAPAGGDPSRFTDEGGGTFDSRTNGHAHPRRDYSRFVAQAGDWELQ